MHVPSKHANKACSASQNNPEWLYATGSLSQATYLQVCTHLLHVPSKHANKACSVSQNNPEWLYATRLGQNHMPYLYL